MSSPASLDQLERGALVAVGAVLTLAGARRTVTAVTLSALGVTLIVQGVSRHSPILDQLSRLTRRMRTAKREERAIDATLEDSFPASDAPAWVSGARR